MARWFKINIYWAGMGQYIDFPIFFNILVMLILILISKLDFPKYWYWYWSWNLEIQNIDIDLDIETNWNIDINIDIDIVKKRQKYRKWVGWKRGKWWFVFSSLDWMSNYLSSHANMVVEAPTRGTTLISSSSLCESQPESKSLIVIWL